MRQVIICRYGEIGIKGGNRVAFERKLAQNVQSCLKSHGVPVERIDRPYGRLIVRADGDAGRFLQTVFGLTSISPAIETAGMEEAETLAPAAFDLKPGERFRVTCQRLDKAFPLLSREVGKRLGLAITAGTGNPASLEEFDRELEAEVLGGKIYLCKSRIPGPGGLPLGIQGEVAGIIRNERDVLAALLVMRRGCAVIPVAEPGTDLGLLKAYASGHPLKAVREAPAGAQVLVNGDAEPAPPSRDLLQLRPLAGITDTDIEEKLNGFRTAALHA